MSRIVASDLQNKTESALTSYDDEFVKVIENACTSAAYKGLYFTDVPLNSLGSVTNLDHKIFRDLRNNGFDVVMSNTVITISWFPIKDERDERLRRIKQEHSELNTKCEKLRKYIDNNKYVVDCSQLEEQLKHMCAYADVLIKRIEQGNY